MKKVLLALALLAAFTACNKDNSTNSKPTVTKLEVSLDVTSISSDILTYFDVTYKYTDFNGNTVSKPITKAESIAFSINNPTLGEEESTPFTVEMTLTEKEGTTPKAAGSEYDATLKYTLNHNGYVSDGSKIEGSRSVISTNATGSVSDYSRFTTECKKNGIKSITYKTWLCKTTSGVWQIGVSGTHN